MKILERKQKTLPDLLCKNYPSEFKEYFAHCSSLDFVHQPDYRYLNLNFLVLEYQSIRFLSRLLKQIFKDLFVRAGYIDDGGEHEVLFLNVD